MGHADTAQPQDAYFAVEQPPQQQHQQHQQPMMNVRFALFTPEEDDLYMKLLYLTVPREHQPFYGYPFVCEKDLRLAVFYHTAPNDPRFPKLMRALPSINKPRAYPRRLAEVFDEKEESLYWQEIVADGHECCRCKKSFSLSNNEECWYHGGRLMWNEMYASSPPRYSCCMNTRDSHGCQSTSDHVWNGLVPGLNGPVGGYVLSQPPTYSYSLHRIVSIDCEMCFTTRGLELTRVTLLSVRGEVIYDTLVMPTNPIVDYNTSFSGLTKEAMEQPGATKTLYQAQEDILQLVDANTILIGHGLENDLRALKMVHFNVVDTALIMPLEKRPSLKRLAQMCLGRTIQRDSKGHDSMEDALACLDLAKYFVASGTMSMGFPLPRQSC